MAKTEKADAAEKPPKKEKKTKVAKEDKPKRKPSAYMMFCKSERANVIKDHPEKTFGEVGRELGVRWKALSQDEKDGYKEE